MHILLLVLVSILVAILITRYRYILIAYYLQSEMKEGKEGRVSRVISLL